MKTLKNLSEEIDEIVALLKSGELDRLTVVAQSKDKLITIDLSQMELLLIAMIVDRL